MSSFFFAMVRLWPLWALPASYAFFELFVYYRRRRQKIQYLIGGMIGFFLLTSLLWLIFRGDKYSDDWVKWLLN